MDTPPRTAHSRNAGGRHLTLTVIVMDVATRACRTGGTVGGRSGQAGPPEPERASGHAAPHAALVAHDRMAKRSPTKTLHPPRIGPREATALVTANGVIRIGLFVAVPPALAKPPIRA